MASRKEDSVARGVAALTALALLCIAFALLLWQRGLRAQRQVGAQRFVESRIGQSSVAGATRSAQAATPAAVARAMSTAGSPTPTSPRAGAMGVSAASGRGGRAAPEQPRRLPAAIENIALRAGLPGAGTPLMVALAATVLCAVAVGWRAGVVAAGAAAVAFAAAVAVFVTARSQRRRLALVVQLPTFLDGIVRLVTLGNSIPAAFQAALQTTEAPLRECLDHVSRMMRAGVEIDRALAHVAALYRLKEFEFVGAVLRLSVKYGGRADVMLERMSAFMRDVEQAERELAAMSAETRLSAWVLAALPLLIGGFLIATNPTYFSAMWSDVDGRRLIYLAFALQVGGGYLLYRMTRLRV